MRKPPIAATRGDKEPPVASRFGLVPNFFSSAPAAPEIIERLWVFAKAGDLDNPIPSLFKEKLFVYLSRFLRSSLLRVLGGAKSFVRRTHCRHPNN
jgi:hypothetical protein